MVQAFSGTILKVPCKNDFLIQISQNLEIDLIDKLKK